MQIIDRTEILRRLDGVDLISAIETGFVAYSRGEAVVPAPGELLFNDPPGDTHIKYGYIKGQPNFAIKVASGFYQNPGIGLSSSQGLILVMSAKTGEPVALLCDDGVLTDIRTAVAGAIAAKYLAPAQIEVIGVIGSGIQAEYQVDYLQSVRPCKNILIWNHRTPSAEAYRDRMCAKGYTVEIASTARDVCAHARLIITTTPSHVPLIMNADVQQGTHITAMGADTAEKNEINPELFSRADRIIVDSAEHCPFRGEILHALATGMLAPERMIELGTLIETYPKLRRGPDDVSIAVLTGLAVQDIAIANAVLDYA